MATRKRAKTTTKNCSQGAISTGDNNIYTALNQTMNPKTQCIGNHAIRFALASGDAHIMKEVKDNYAQKNKQNTTIYKWRNNNIF